LGGGMIKQKGGRGGASELGGDAACRSHKDCHRFSTKAGV
jgi:hypothetical protein